jgi:hypothetical protein
VVLGYGRQRLVQGRLYAGLKPLDVERHCEERSDEAIQIAAEAALDCFASLAMTAAVRRSGA